MRQEFLSWLDVDTLIDHLIPQFNQVFDCMIVITRGGIVPGGLLAEALRIEEILTAAVDFPAEVIENEPAAGTVFSWPQFLQFPEPALVRGKKILIVDDVWGSGRTITAVRNRLAGSGAEAYTCVLHFNPYRNLLNNIRPDYYGAITDALIVYPWEVRRGRDRVALSPAGPQ